MYDVKEHFCIFALLHLVFAFYVFEQMVEDEMIWRVASKSSAFLRFYFFEFGERQKSWWKMKSYGVLYFLGRTRRATYKGYKRPETKKAGRTP